MSDALALRLKAFHLPSFLSNYTDLARRAEQAGWSYIQYLECLAELEATDRQNRRARFGDRGQPFRGKVDSQSG